MLLLRLMPFPLKLKVLSLGAKANALARGHALYQYWTRPLSPNWLLHALWLHVSVLVRNTILPNT